MATWFNLPIMGFVLAHWVGERTDFSCSTPRFTAANPVEALFDRGETGFDHRLELDVGENVGPVVLNAFADKLADIGRIDAM